MFIFIPNLKNNNTVLRMSPQHLCDKEWCFNFLETLRSWRGKRGRKCIVWEYEWKTERDRQTNSRNDKECLHGAGMDAVVDKSRKVYPELTDLLVNPKILMGEGYRGRSWYWFRRKYFINRKSRMHERSG